MLHQPSAGSQPLLELDSAFDLDPVDAVAQQPLDLLDSLEPYQAVEETDRAASEH